MWLSLEKTFALFLPEAEENLCISDSDSLGRQFDSGKE